MKLRAIYDCLVIKPSSYTHEGSIAIPDKYQRVPSHGVVRSVGRAVSVHVEVGDHVELIPRDGPQPELDFRSLPVQRVLETNDGPLLIVHESQVMGHWRKHNDG